MSWGILFSLNFYVVNVYLQVFCFISMYFSFLISSSRVLVVLQANAKCNFDETVEAHVQLGIDAKRNVICQLI